MASEATTYVETSRSKIRTKLGDDIDDEEFHVVWSDYVQEVIWWLKDSKKERDSNIMKAVVGLIKYDAITQEKLQNVGRGDYESFKKDLSAEGIPKAICDLLFEKYVATKKRSASHDRDGDGKKIKLLERSDPDTTVSILFTNIHRTQDGSTVWTFAENILDSRDNLLYVRDCYPKMYDEMWRLAVRNKGVMETDYYLSL